MEKSIQSIIEELEQQASKEKASFGIFQYGGGSDESYIKANKDGLILFALELLKGANQAEKILKDKEKTIIPIPYEEKWHDDESDISVQYIQPTNDRLVERQETQITPKFNNNLLGVGCLFVLALLVVSIVIGLWSIIQWVF